MYFAQCNSPSVMLSVMFYLSLLTPFLMMLITCKQARIIFPFLLIIASAIALAPKLLHNFPIAPQEVASMSSTYESKISLIRSHYATDQLLVPFLLGSLLGYLLKCKPSPSSADSSFPIKDLLKLGLFTTPMWIAVFWSETLKPLEAGVGNFSQSNLILWIVFGKFLWIAGLVAVIYACASGSAGI